MYSSYLNIIFSSNHAILISLFLQSNAIPNTLRSELLPLSIVFFLPSFIGNLALPRYHLTPELLLSFTVGLALSLLIKRHTAMSKVCSLVGVAARTHFITELIYSKYKSESIYAYLLLLLLSENFLKKSIGKKTFKLTMHEILNLSLGHVLFTVGRYIQVSERSTWMSIFVLLCSVEVPTMKWRSTPKKNVRPIRKASVMNA